MPDPFLLAHAAYSFCFDVSGRLAPISIRDQMVRARTIVDRAIAANLIGTRKPLVVAGGGAAGITAALRAAEKGVPTLLVEAQASLFSRQAGCRSRWIDPVQYDWPVIHWNDGHYPSRPPAMVLPWRAGYANVVALQWQTAVRGAVRSLGGSRPWIYTGVRVAGVRVHPPGTPLPLDVQLAPAGAPAGAPVSVVAAGMLLTCTGFGAEDCNVFPSYTGFRFWDTDKLGAPDLGLPAGPPAKVLISGGGDGALQDVLRVLTQNKSARDIYNAVWRGLTTSPSVKKALKDTRIEVEDHLQSAEDQAQRTYLWGHTPEVDHYGLQAVHDAHLDAINTIRTEPAIWSAVCEVLQAVTASAPAVTLAHRCTHFSGCYGLNRFLVLLLHAYCQYNGPKNLDSENG